MNLSTRKSSWLSNLGWSTVLIIGFNFLAYQHKAAGRKTRLNIQNYVLRKVSFGWITHTNIKFIKNNQKVLYFWRFDLCQRPSAEEAGTRSSSSGSWRDKLVSSQESGRMYDWVGSSLRPGSWIVDLPSGYELPPWSIWYIDQTLCQLQTLQTNWSHDSLGLRGLSVPVKSHRSSSSAESNRLALTDHAVQENHVISWSAASVIDRESDRCTRWIKEAVHIWKEGPRSMNRDKGSYQLSHTYDRFLGSTLTLVSHAKNRKKKT